MSKPNFSFSIEAISAMKVAKSFSRRLELTAISDVVMFSVVVSSNGTLFNKYLKSKDISEEQILNNIQMLLTKYNDYMHQEAVSTIIMDIPEQENLKEEFKISQNMHALLIKASEIGENYYNKGNITLEFLVSAFAELQEDMFKDFMLLCYSEYEENTTKPKKFLSEDQHQINIPSELSSFIYLMNDKYSSTEKECPILGREEEIASLINVLAKSTKRNAVLVGEPGVGKTAIVEKFTWSVVTHNCEKKFSNAKVIVLDVNSIVAGTQYRGTAEMRFQNLIKFLEENPDCILFIDEIHTILGAGACREGDVDLANALKPILARGKTRVIGATTSEEYEKYFSRDAALKRRFEKIYVREPRTHEIYNMIKNQIKRLENFHGVKISQDLVNFAILNASCFNYETKNPDRTLDLLDRSMATASLKGKNRVGKKDILDNFSIKMKQFNNMDKELKKAIAYHEAGHFIVQEFSSELKYYNTLAISIMPADDYLGVNVYEKDENVITSGNREYFIQLIARSLGGRRAEKLYTGKLSAGASADLLKATHLAKDMITRYGLVEEFTEDRVYLRESKNPMYTDSVIEKINDEIDKILVESKKYVDDLLMEHHDELEIVVDALMKNGILSKKEIESILSKYNKY